MDDFYITLPSSVKNTQFDNTSSRYVTRLPEVLQLERDKYVVAVTDIIYPYSFVNVGRPLNYWIHFKNRDPVHITFPAAQYSKLDEVIDALNGEVRPRPKRSAPIDLEPEDVPVKRQRGDDGLEENQRIIDKFKKLFEEERVKNQQELEKARRVFDEHKKRVKRTTVVPTPEQKLIDKFKVVGEETLVKTKKKLELDNKFIKKFQNVGDGAALLADQKREGDQRTINKFAKVFQGHAANQEKSEKAMEEKQAADQKEIDKFARVFQGHAANQEKEEAAEKEEETTKPVIGQEVVPDQDGKNDEDVPEHDPIFFALPLVDESKSVFPKLEHSTPIRETTPAPIVVKEDNAQGEDDEKEEERKRQQKLIDSFKRVEQGQQERDKDVSQAQIDKFKKVEKEILEAKQQTIDKFKAIPQQEIEKFKKVEKESAAERQKAIDKFKSLQQNHEQQLQAARDYNMAALAVFDKPANKHSYEEARNHFARIRQQIRTEKVKNGNEWIHFSERDKRIHIDILAPEEVLFVEFETSCAYFLGFLDPIVRESGIAASKVDYFGNVSTLYLYCDIVDPIIVGDSKNSVLSVIPCRGKYGEMIHHSIPYPRYLPIMNNTIDSIKVELLSEFAEPINFNWGSTIIVLHFKKI